MHFFLKSNFDFMAWRKVAIAISLVAILVGLISLVVKGGPDYNIDFLGGSEIEVRFPQPKTTLEVRNALNAINLGDAEIKELGDPHLYIIRFLLPENIVKNPNAPNSDAVMAAFAQAFPNEVTELLANSTIGPKIGQELRLSAVWAILVSLGLIFVYITYRFQSIFAVGAVVALFHDVLITLGFFSLMNREISLAVIGAFLTLVGYSLNDTIVVFDRIRENLKVHRREMLSIDQVINRSINDTLSRTILTGVTTLMVVIVCLLIGGEVLRDFFLCLLIGILVGTYSSIFIAAPVVAKWYQKSRTSHTHSKLISHGPKPAVHH